MKKIILGFLLILFSVFQAQTELVFVYFTDKPNKGAFYANPLSELTQKSLNRRSAMGIPLNDQDAPLEITYVQNIENLGFTVTDKSKWLNGVAVNATAAQVTILKAQPYVQSVQSFAKNSQVVTKHYYSKKFEEFDKTLLANFNYGNSAQQIDQINLRNLHISGYTGNGITIAVLDTGFPTVDTGSAYQRLWTMGKIKGGYNFVTKNTDIYNTSLNTHGSVVLGVIGGYIDGTFVGAAPDADFFLYATEKTPEEVPEEQLYWIQAAEEADRKGVDIITSSLGYSTFDNPIYNYDYSDMNGTTTFIARGAQIAAEKGIFVLSSAGNEGQKPWHYILSPADNMKVFSVGAVDATGAVSSFSSFGPNSAGVIKPDACARGTATATVMNNSATSASGTSLSAPLAAGGVACLLQALPPSVSKDFVRNKLRETASLYPSTSDQMGYGILNFGNALTQINTALSTHTAANKIDAYAYPNPFKEILFFKTSENIQKIELYDQLGRLIHTEVPKFNFINISSLKNGVYYLKFFTEKGFVIQKVIKEASFK